MPRRSQKSDKIQFMREPRAEPNLFELCRGEARNRIKSNLSNRQIMANNQITQGDIEKKLEQINKRNEHRRLS